MPERAPLNYAAHGTVLDLLSGFGKIGVTESGGYSRLAASSEDGQARDFLCDWLRRHDFKVLVDGIGNIFGVLDLVHGDPARHFFCGSHIDSQPDGGNFDGVLGVVCACVCGLEIRNAVANGRVDPSCRFYVVACWTGEEGARFQPSLIGSSVFVGSMSLEFALARQDQDGVSLSRALSEIGYLGNAQAPAPAHYLELHIEQGARLETAETPVAIVSSCWGAKKLLVEVSGRPDHTGPTPMEERRDALLAASHLVVQANEVSRRSSSTLYSSVGRMEIAPNSPNTIADKVRIWVEFRSSNGDALVAAERQFEQSFDTIAASTGCTLKVVTAEDREVVEFDQESIAAIEDVLSASNTPYLHMSTIAGHDAIRLQSICPSTLLFVPSKDGISHSPEEFTSDDDVCSGFDAMLHAVVRLICVPASRASAVAAGTGH